MVDVSVRRSGVEYNVRLYLTDDKVYFFRLGDVSNEVRNVIVSVLEG